MDVHASLRHLRMAPRKVRLVVDLVRGLPVPEAELRLKFLKKDAARPVLKLLQSAMANAAHNFKLDPSTLKVARIMADAGVTLKRFTPRAMGRATPIRKRTTHITLVLSDGRPVVSSAPQAETAKAASQTEPAKAAPKKTASRSRSSSAKTPKKTAAKKSANA